MSKKDSKPKNALITSQQSQSPGEPSIPHPKSPAKLAILSSEELAEQNLLCITKYKVEKKSNKMDPDTYLAHLNSKKAGQLQSLTSDNEKKLEGNLREISPWTDKKAKIPTAVDLMIKKKKDAQK